MTPFGQQPQQGMDLGLPPADDRRGPQTWVTSQVRMNQNHQYAWAIESRDTNELEEALRVCESLDGFSEPKANKVLLQRAEQMKGKVRWSERLLLRPRPAQAPTNDTGR